MKLRILLLIAAAAPAFFPALSASSDSLKRALGGNIPDTVRVQLLLDLAQSYQQVSPDSGLVYAFKAGKLADRSPYLKGRARAYQVLGLLYYRKGELDSSLMSNEEALRLLPEVNDELLSSKVWGTMGLVYWNKGDYPKALQFLLDENRVVARLRNMKSLAVNLGNIANVYADQGDFRTASSYYDRALQIHDSLGQWNDYAVICGNIGYNYLKRYFGGAEPGALDSLAENSFRWLQRSYELAEKYGNLQLQARQLGNLGIVYSLRKDYAKSLEAFEKSVKLKEEVNDQVGIANTLGNIAGLYFQLKNYDKSLDYYQRSLSLALRIRDASDALYARKSIMEIYALTGRWKEAYNMQGEYYAMRDSMFNARKSKEMGRLEAKSEYEKQKLVADLQHKKEMELAGEKEKRQQVMIAATGGGGVIVLVFSFLLAGRLRTIRIQKRQIEEQKELVELRNREVTDSLNYARRIQRSLFPPESSIDRSLKRLN